MKAIETFYNGNLYRSRLEAKWAYFFDLLGISFTYEPEGFKSNKGEMYLPDFYLYDTYLRDSQIKGVYIEIKPINHGHEHKAQEWFNKPLVMFCGQPSDAFNVYGSSTKGNIDSGYQIYPQWDNCMGIWICKKCGLHKIEFMGGTYNRCNRCSGIGDIDRVITAADETKIKRF